MAEIPEFRRILILGAGVVGSVYAARLKAAGVDVAVPVGGWLTSASTALSLMNRITKKLTVCRIASVDNISSHDRYDLVLVIARKNQVDTVLPATRKSDGGRPSLIPRQYCFWIRRLEPCDRIRTTHTRISWCRRRTRGHHYSVRHPAGIAPAAYFWRTKWRSHATVAGHCELVSPRRFSCGNV